MARKLPVEFKMNFQINFCTAICGRHVYKDTWKPTLGERLECYKDQRKEAEFYHIHAIGVYEMKDGHKELVGHFANRDFDVVWGTNVQIWVLRRIGYACNFIAEMCL